MKAKTIRELCKIFFASTFILMLTSCGSSSGNDNLLSLSDSSLTCTVDERNNINVESEIAQLATSTLYVAAGSTTANLVYINTQGGPMSTLLNADGPGGLIGSYSSINLTTSLLVNVQQEHILHKSKYSSSSVTLTQARSITKKTTAILNKVINHFRSQNKTIHLVGISYGAFMVADYLATYGTQGYNKLDKISMLVARLDLEENVWKNFAQGMPVIFNHSSSTNSTAFTITTATNSQAGMSAGTNNNIIAAGVGCNRFTQLLGDSFTGGASLTKIYYGYGTKDEQIGSLTTNEVNFLTDRGATVKAKIGGTHETSSIEFINSFLVR